MKIGFVSLGCPKNLVDSEVMLGLARQDGHEITPDASQADVIVVNTCAFIDRAKEESIDAILEMARYKSTGRCRRLIVTGCLAERYPEALRQQLPEVDAVLGTDEVGQIVPALHPSGANVTGQPMMLVRSARDARGGSGGPAATPVRPTYIYDATTPRLLTTPPHLAYVKIGEGCDYSCTFCIIPTLRGGYRSRPMDSIVREARDLADRGVKELVLISQDTTFYGVDRGERSALARLLRALNDVDGLEWIRLLYLYPTTVDDETIDAMTTCVKVCRYVDLPLQHASTDVLKRMGRPGTRRTYDRLLEKIRQRVPGVTLRTTFIVGFPGETDADFAELCAFVRDVEFDHVGVFVYSHEEGTRAHKLADDVPGPIKQQRRRRLMALQQRIVARRQRERVGQTALMRIDGPSPEHALVMQARLEGQAPEIDPVVYLTECDLSTSAAGQLITATIVGAHGYDLVARSLPSPRGRDTLT